MKLHTRSLLYRTVPLMLSALQLLLLNACSEKETLDLPSTSDYYPQAIGKYIIYRLDSTVIVNSGQTVMVKSYQVKDLIEGTVTDNAGRTAFRIRRQIRDTSATRLWEDNATFIVTPVANGFEYWDNGLRFIKLKDPVRNDFSWKGNSFIDTYSLNSTLKWMDGWDYTYRNVGQPFTSGGRTFPNTVTVEQRNEILGNVNDPNAYSEQNIAWEVYASGVGLVHKNFLHIEYQPPAPPRNIGYRVGYGVKLTFIDTNW